MNEQIEQKKLMPSFSKRFSTVFKMAGIFVLVLLLLIPLTMIKSVLFERLGRKNQAISEITSTWGKEQVIVGPVLVIPYRYYFKAWKEEIVNGKYQKKEIMDSATATAFFLPAEVKVKGELTPRKLHRGIYDAIVYSGKLSLSGTFTPPDFESLKVKDKDVLWKDAIITFGITDLRGISEALKVTWNGKTYSLLPGSKLDCFSSGLHAQLYGVAPSQKKFTYEFNLNLNGSRGISFAPAGVQNDVTLASSWPDPSFKGAFLPKERKITPNGFEAQWQMSYYGRDYPQLWTDKDEKSPFSYDLVRKSLFGVELISLVDSYRNVERSIKYGILFIVFIFTAFFLFEVLSPVKIHVFQYTLVGAALCLFYLGLLALSEFISFPIAYLSGAAAATLLISLYSMKALKSGKRTMIIAALLAVIYVFLYVILHMQDYSLLAGTIGLFAALGTVMYATRNIDWYARDNE